MHYLIAAVLPPSEDYAITTVPDPLWRRLDPDALTGQASPALLTALEDLLAPFNENTEEDDPRVEVVEEPYTWVDDEGIERTEIGRYNPRGEWDWWVLGGRYAAKMQQLQGITVAQYIAALAVDPGLAAYGVAYPTEGDAVWWSRSQQDGAPQWDDPAYGEPGTEEYRRRYAAGYEAATQRWATADFPGRLRRLPANGYVVFIDCHS